MNTKERIAKLEKELAQLKGIIEAKKEKKIIYDGDNLYVGIDEIGKAYLLVGKEDYFCFHSFRDVEWSWEGSFSSGQEAIDSAVNDGPSLIVYEFSNHIEGMEFFMEKYRKYYKEN